MTGLRAAGSRVRLLAAAALVVTGTLLTGVPGASAHPGDTAIQIAPTEAEAGSTVTVSGEGFTAGTDVSLVLRTGEGDEQLAITAVDDEGHFAAAVTLGGSLDTRYYELHAVGRDETATQLLSVTADPEAEPAAAGPLAPLSSPGLPVLLLAGAVALGAVAAVVALVRRRGPMVTGSR